MKAEQLTLNFPATTVPTGRPDGAYLVIPGKPVILEKELTVREVAKLSGYSERWVQQMAHKELGGRQRRRRCKIRIPASAVARLMDARA